MDLERILRAASDLGNIRVALATVGLGLALLTVLVFAARLVQRQRIKKPDAIALVVMLLLGVGLSAFARFGIPAPPGPAPNPLGYAGEAPSPAEQTDDKALAQLRTAKLTPPTPVSSGDDWPQWFGPARNGSSPATGLRTDWTRQPPALVWKRPIGRGYASLAVVGNRVYTLDFDGKDHERVLCLDAATGDEVWAYPYEANSKSGGYAGPRATPAVHDGRVYTVSADGRFLCLEANPADRRPKLLWEHKLLDEFGANMPGHGVACSPLIEGDLVIVQPGSKKGASVVAFHRKSGEVVWRSMADPAGYSSPVAATAAGVRQIIVFTAHGAAGIRAADGTPLWHFSWPTAYNVNAATPVVAGDYVFISSGYSVGCALLQLVADNGAVAVKPVYVRKGKLMRNHHMTSVLRDGHLYGCDDSGRQELKCIDLRAGQEKWATQKVGKHTLIYADGHLIALNEDGALVLLECSPAGYREKGRLTGALTGTECWALPALAAGRLYLRGHHNVACLDLRAAARAQAK